MLASGRFTLDRRPRSHHVSASAIVNATRMMSVQTTVEILQDRDRRELRLMVGLIRRF